MEESASEEVRQSAFTPRAFVIGLILVAAWSFFINYAGMSLQSFAVLGRLTNILATSILTIVVLRWLSSLLKERGFGEGELILIYVMLMSSLFQMIAGFAGDIPLWGISTPLYGMIESWASYHVVPNTPSFWFPDASVTEPMLLGGAAVPWGAWATPLVFWLSYQMSFVVAYLCLGLILSGQIIETERLPFPFASTVHQIIKEPRKGYGEVINSRLVITAVVVGFVIQATYGLVQVAIPSLPVWPDLGYGMLGFDLGPLVGPQYALNQCLVVPVGDIAFTVALMFLVPSKILLTALLVSPVAWNIIMIVQTQMGLLSNYPALYGDYGLMVLWLAIFGDWDTGTAVQMYLVQMGVVTGVALSFLALSYKAFGRSLRGAISGKRSGRFPDNLLWIGFIGGLLLHFGLQLASSVPITAMLVIFLMSLVVMYMMTRMRGEAIFTETSFDNWPRHGLVFMSLGGDPALGTTGLYTSVMLTHAENMFFTAGASSWMVLEGFRLCEMTKTKWRGIAFSALVSVFVALVISWFLYVWGAYTHGFHVGWPAGGWTAVAEDADSYFWLTTEDSLGVPWLWGDNPRIWPDFTVGFIIAIVITALSFTYAWFPLHPVGLVLGFGAMGYLWGATLWFQGLLGLIARTLVLRTGGSELYERKGVPVATGIIIGTAVANFLYGLATIAGIG